MNKFLVLVYVPLLEEEYDIYIPINKKVGTIKKIIIDSVAELSELSQDKLNNLKLYDKVTSNLYNNDILVKNSGIMNGTKLLLM